MKGSFRVRTGPRAEADLRVIHGIIARDRPKTAAKVVRELTSAARSLRTMPLRYEIVPEAEDLGMELRHFLSKGYRIIYRVEVAEVIVVRIVHGSYLLTARSLEGI